MLLKRTVVALQQVMEGAVEEDEFRFISILPLTVSLAATRLTVVTVTDEEHRVQYSLKIAIAEKEA